MNKEQANAEAKKIYDNWKKNREIIKQRAKRDGTWSDVGLDSNNHIFKEADDEAKEALKELQLSVEYK